jgi:tetratricopeptide (TPR) repeat protein
MLSPRPLVFISAVTNELKSARQLVANTLTFLGYEPVWQDIFGTEGGDLRQVLRQKIDQCKGVLQLVGKSYGAGPATPDDKFGQVSYTQYEALYARERGKKVWYLFIDENFPTDPCDGEAEELRELQAAYRRRVQADTHLFHPLTNRDALEMSVLKLRDDLVRLRRGVKQWAAAVAILLIVSVGLGFFLLRVQHQTAREVRETKQAMAAMTDEMAQLRKGIAEYPRIEAQMEQSQPSEDPVETREKIYAELAKQLGVDPKRLREKLPQVASQMKTAPNTTSYERANAAFVAKSYEEAERLALQSASEAQKAPSVKTEDAIRAFELAAWAAQSQIHLGDAFQHLRDAATLTDRQHDPKGWARIQHDLGQVLFHQGNYSQAEKSYRNAVEVRAAALGPQHLETMRSRMGLAEALSFEGRFADGETENRQVLAIQEKSLGPNDPNTLTTRRNLALALIRKGEYAKAENEAHQVVELQSKVLGHDHPDTLESRNVLAMALAHQSKVDEALSEYREILQVRQKRLGPERPQTLLARHNVALMLARQRDYSGAEKELREVSQIASRVLGPDHPTTLLYRFGLAGTLRDEGKFAEAEAEFRDVIQLRTKVLGSEHPATLESEFGLAQTLKREHKTDEAREVAQRLMVLAPKTWGENHPTTQLIRKLCDNLQEKR